MGGRREEQVIRTRSPKSRREILNKAKVTLTGDIQYFLGAPCPDQERVPIDPLNAFRTNNFDFLTVLMNIAADGSDAHLADQPLCTAPVAREKRR